MHLIGRNTALSKADGFRVVVDEWDRFGNGVDGIVVKILAFYPLPDGGGGHSLQCIMEEVIDDYTRPLYFLWARKQRSLEEMVQLARGKVLSMVLHLTQAVWWEYERGKSQGAYADVEIELQRGDDGEIIQAQSGSRMWTQDQIEGMMMKEGDDDLS